MSFVEETIQLLWTGMENVVELSFWNENEIVEFLQNLFDFPIKIGHKTNKSITNFVVRLCEKLIDGFVIRYLWKNSTLEDY